MRGSWAGALLLLAFTLGCTDRPSKAKFPKSASEWAVEAASLRQADKKDDAVRAYDQAIDMDPRLDSAIYHRALIYVELGRDQEAASACKELMNRKSSFGKQLHDQFLSTADANISMGHGHIDKSEWDLADKKFQVAIVYNPDATDAHIGRGVALAQQKKHDEAVKAFNRAIYVDPNSVAAFRHRAKVHVERGDADKAQRDFEMALFLEKGKTRAVEVEGAKDKK